MYPHDGQCEHNDMDHESVRCTDPATTILEYELEGQHGGPNYYCRHHATYNAELILGAGGSPRLGNV
jgi:hypothetical protein